MPRLFPGRPPGADAEQFVELLSRPGLRIERIVSTGQASPPGFWYDQPQAEWVLVLQGEATLAFEDAPELRRLRAGDFIDIAPHRRHRVESSAVPTVWLGVHYDCKESPWDGQNRLAPDARLRPGPQPISSNSTSNTSVALAGITPPAPRAP
jgi:cupin 2 domain-containing protein